MTTKMPNPHYPPEICIKVTLINFTVTFEGLEEQLLGDVVVKEKPEVEAQRDKIVIQMSEDKKTRFDRLHKRLNKQVAALVRLIPRDPADTPDLAMAIKNTEASTYDPNT